MNNAIRVVNSTGIISTIFRQAQIYTIALDSLGNLYLGGANAVYRMNNQTIPLPSVLPSSSVTSTPIVRPSSPSNSTIPTNNGSSIPSIIGGVVGGVLILGGLVALAVMYCRQRRSRKPLTRNEPIQSFTSKRRASSNSRRDSTTEGVHRSQV